jgi:pimeloyl-ACP methyl ester carboxylesterase
MRQLRLIPALLLALAASPSLAETTPGDALRSALTSLGAKKCDDTDLTCLTIKVPRDHRANDPTSTLDISFAINLASDESKGILFYSVGGPGGSGVNAAEGYLAAFDESLTANMDIVFFDQRGIGPIHGIQCATAQAAYESADLPIDNPDLVLATTQTYVTNCLAEMSSTDLLGLVNTDQAIRDLEVFRQAIGAPKVWIYGESYGTQFAQEYATAFPDAIKGVILDGVVDLTRSFEGYYATYVDGSERILTRVFDTCKTITDCQTDMKDDAAQLYDNLIAKLRQSPIDIELPLGDDTTTKRQLTLGMAETNAFYALYGPDDRATFLRALAAASRQNYLPMLRLAYENLTVDPATGDPKPDPDWFGAAYYAITCTDYADEGANTDDVVAKILADTKAFAANAPRLLRTYYSERLVCALWPNKGDPKRPEPFAGGDYPTIVLNADTDPITPATMAYSVYDNVKNGYLVVMQGGPHVIWGRGLACPDEVVASLLYDDTLPEQAVQICEQPFVEDYTPLTLLDPTAADAAFTVAAALETEIGLSPGLQGWDGEDPLSVGCDHGGHVTVSSQDDNTAYDFAACAWWPGLVFEGTGVLIENDEPGDGMTLTLTISGNHSGQIVYRSNTINETKMLSGSYDGKDVSTPRPLP